MQNGIRIRGKRNDISGRHDDVLRKSTDGRLAQHPVVGQCRVDQDQPSGEVRNRDSDHSGPPDRVHHTHDLPAADVREVDVDTGHAMTHEKVQSAERASDDPDPDLAWPWLGPLDPTHLKDLGAAVAPYYSSRHLTYEPILHISSHRWTRSPLPRRSVP